MEEETVENTNFTQSSREAQNLLHALWRLTNCFPAFKSFQGANGQGSCSHNEKESPIQEKNTDSRLRPFESILNKRTRICPHSPSNWERLLNLMESTLNSSRTLADDPKNWCFRLSMTFLPRQSCRKFSNDPMWYPFTTLKRWHRTCSLLNYFIAERNLQALQAHDFTENPTHDRASKTGIEAVPNMALNTHIEAGFQRQLKTCVVFVDLIAAYSLMRWASAEVHVWCLLPRICAVYSTTC
jgi:hypothetical protein